MNYIIKIDNREKDLINLLKEKGYDTEQENLDIGDIQFVDINTKQIVIVIERKTYADLSASIKDGRYKEQKERMIHSIPILVRKIMLIEGEKTNFSDFTLHEKTFHSVILNTMLRDNIHIHLTNNLESTLDFIENIIFQIPKYYDDVRDEVISGLKKECINEYNCSAKKKENVHQDIAFRNMLAVIPGISTKMASVYVEKYKNMENFINTLKLESNNDGNKIIKILGEEKYGERKIGEKIGEKIYNFLFDTSNFVIVKKVKKQTKKIVTTKIDEIKNKNSHLFQESLFSS
jgi:crossover junction endonuclease MUS81